MIPLKRKEKEKKRNNWKFNKIVLQQIWRKKTTVEKKIFFK